MDNNYNNNKQVNNPNTNQPVEQNNDLPHNAKPQTNYNTYSSVPGIFNNQNTVSQNRNIPPAHNPSNTSHSQIRQPVQNTSVPNQSINNNIKNKNRVSDGRAFAQEFYPQSTPQQTEANNQQSVANTRPQVNSQANNQQPMVNTRPQVNSQANNQQPIANTRPQVNSQVNTQPKFQHSVNNDSLSSNPEVNPQPGTANTDNSNANNIVNPQKREVKYNYEALTPPDKKSTSIIIAIYVIVILLLLVGIIGYAITSGSSSNSKKSFTEFFDDISIEDIFANDSDESYSNNYQIDTMQDQPFEEDDSYDVRTLTYVDDNEALELYLSVTDPSGFEFQESLSSDDLIVFHNDENNLTCKAKLTAGDSNNLSGLISNIMNPNNENTTLNKIGYYPTSYGEAVIYQIEFDNRIETYGFVNRDDNVVFAVYISKFAYDEDVEDEIILSTIEEVLDNIY